jgi:hypothetical protein
MRYPVTMHGDSADIVPPASVRQRSRPAGAASTGLPPPGLRGALAICFLSAGRAACSALVLSAACVALWVVCLAASVPLGGKLLLALVVLPGGALVLPVAGVLQGQSLPPDFRQLGARQQVRLWLRARRLCGWPLAAGGLADPVIRRHAHVITARAERIAPLARGARAALTAELAAALRGVDDPDRAATLVDEAVARVARWEESAAGLPPVGAKLYLRHDPLTPRAARARHTAACLGVPSDRLNYFWRGQVLLLPPARSHRTIAALIDGLLAAGVADPGAPLPLQITVQGALGDDAKLIALVQLLAGGLDLAVEGPERRGDEGNLIARGLLPPEPVAGDPGWERTDFLFSLVWATVPELAAAGYADQHHRDLRVVQTLSAALLAAQQPVAAGPRPRPAPVPASIWRQFARDIERLCAAWGVAEAVRARYLGVPFAAVRPAIERLLARKAVTPALRDGARRLRDRALAQTEFALVAARLAAAGRMRRVRVRCVGAEIEREFRFAAGLRHVRRALGRGARVVLAARDGDRLALLLDDPPPGGME